MKRKLLFFMLATMPAVTFATIIGEDITRTTVLVQPDDLGTAAYSNATDFATAAQGELAVSAVQPEALGTMAYAETNDYNTQAAADLRYASRDGSTPMTDDVDMDGYDIADAGIIHAESVELNTPSRPYYDSLVLPLYTTINTKRGYWGGSDDFFGATNGVGFYCVDADDAADFPLTYLSTNNYIKVGCPEISLTSNYISKITGYGTCTDNNSPVAGLLVGDNYVTFNYETNYVARVAATFAKFGSPIATLTPDVGSEYKAAALLEVSYVQSVSSSQMSVGKSSVFLCYGGTLSTPSTQSRIIPIISEAVGPASGPEINYKGNKLIYFNFAGYQSSPDNTVITPNRINFTALTTSKDISITPE